jgi:nicotinate-nucleotide pyrophosphorylase (carboxylating)
MRDLRSMYEAARRTGLIRRVLELARDEDLGSVGDLTSAATIDPARRGRYAVVPRQAAVLAGLAAIPDLLEVFAPGTRATLHAADGTPATPRVAVATLEGPVREILALERTLLNLISRLSGIATRTRAFLDAMGPRRGDAPALCDTRKTTPGMRVLEKYAVACGGGTSHRMGLFDAVLIKDNHLAGVAAKDFPKAVARAIAKVQELARDTASGGRGERPEFTLAFIEVEVDDLDQFRAILAEKPEGLGMVLLDNMNPDTLRRAVAMRNESWPALILEASGGVSLATIGEIAAAGVDRISVGSLTHRAVSIDVGLDACA